MEKMNQLLPLSDLKVATKSNTELATLTETGFLTKNIGTKFAIYKNLVGCLFKCGVCTYKSLKRAVLNYQ